MDALVARANALLSRYQSPIAWALVAVLVVQLFGVFTLPHALELAIVAAAGALGIARPSETAAKIAGEVMAVRGGVTLAAIVAAIAGTTAAVDPNPVTTADQSDDAIVLVDAVPPEVIEVPVPVVAAEPDEVEPVIAPKDVGP